MFILVSVQLFSIDSKGQQCVPCQKGWTDWLKVWCHRSQRRGVLWGSVTIGKIFRILSREWESNVNQTWQRDSLQQVARLFYWGASFASNFLFFSFLHLFSISFFLLSQEGKGRDFVSIGGIDKLFKLITQKQVMIFRIFNSTWAEREQKICVCMCVCACCHSLLEEHSDSFCAAAVPTYQ